MKKQAYISAPSVELLLFACADPLLSSFTVPPIPSNPGVTTNDKGEIELPPMPFIFP